MTLEKQLKLFPTPKRSFINSVNIILEQNYSGFLSIYQREGIVTLEKPYQLTEFGLDKYNLAIKEIQKNC